MPRYLDNVSSTIPPTCYFVALRSFSIVMSKQSCTLDDMNLDSSPKYPFVKGLVILAVMWLRSVRIQARPTCDQPQTDGAEVAAPSPIVSLTWLY